MLKSLLASVCLAAALAASSVHADNPSPNPPPTTSQFSAISAHDQVRQMGRGVKIIGYDPFWQDGGKGNYSEKHFAELKAAGFSTVRVVLFGEGAR